MEYLEAKKTVQAQKKRENYLVVRLGYDHVLVLPYKEGLAFIASLEKAERFDSEYSPQRILPIDRDGLRVSLLAVEDYERHKIAALLNVTVEEVKQHEQPQAAPA